MKHVFLVLLAFAVACTSRPNPESPIEHTAAAKELRAMSVALVEQRWSSSSGKLRTRAYCTGTWISVNQILTAAHCVVDDFKVGDAVLYSTVGDVLDEDNDRVVAVKSVLQALDAPHDLALLRAIEYGAHPIAHVAFGVTQGQFAQTMGQSLGLWFSYSNGSVAAIRHFTNPDDGVANAPDMLWVQTTAPISPGNSGGALFDENGDVLGVCHGSFTRGQLLNVYVHRDHVSAFLRVQGVQS